MLKWLIVVWLCGIYYFRYSDGKIGGPPVPILLIILWPITFLVCLVFAAIRGCTFLYCEIIVRHKFKSLNISDKISSGLETTKKIIPLIFQPYKLGECCRKKQEEEEKYYDD